MMKCQSTKTLKKLQLKNQLMDSLDSNKSICKKKNRMSKDNRLLTTFMKIITK